MQVSRASILLRPRRFVRRHPLVVQPARWRAQKVLAQSKQLARKAGPRRVISIALFAVGGMLCTYVAGSYTWMYAEQKKLLHEWKSRQSGISTLTKLSIPRIGLQDVVLEGATPHSLLLGPAHLSGSAVPGSDGNSVIAGHRDTFFRHVHSLRPGDDIYILRGGKQFHYVVVRRKIVEPNDLSVLRATNGRELTLITCYPTHAIGPAPERLIVVAQLKSHSP
jgi:LPXTG-site transpeptidase (sortase) family protein